MILKIWTLFYLLCITQVASFGQVSCCCGTPKELDFPGFDFEIPPDPPPGWFNTFAVGQTMGQWDITKGFIDQVDKAHYFNTGYGNPNGPSTFVDLFGSPPYAGSASGAIKYTLTGLTPSNQYTLQFYYAKFDVPGNFVATIKIANGAWLNESLTATNPGNIIWLKASYPFTAQTSSANLEFIDAGSSSCCGVGVLIDDIKIFECPFDNKKPVVNNPPKDVEVECEQNIPQVPTLSVTDNCDPSPNIAFNENTDVIDNCTKVITRTWTITDACGNINTQTQIINVIDKSQPKFTILPQNKLTGCDTDVLKVFNDWIKKNGDAIATDACGSVKFRTVYSRLPKKTCDSIVVDFIATDPCGNEIDESAYFIVKDSMKSKFINKPQDKDLTDVPNIRDSLKSWLITYGFSTTSSGCDTTILSSNFDGDSTQNPIKVTFYIRDRCGNIDSASASFSYHNNNITCCCGAPRLMDFPGFDFEIGPFPGPAGYIPYVAVNPFGPWLVTNGAIDIGDKDYCGALAAGNPNGPSYFIDLFGSPPTGSVAGTLEYLLTGLTPGYTYTIEFWYATFTSNGNFSANLKVANGAWLNVNWTANNPGSVIWLKKTYSFIAKATTANLSFTDTGPSSTTYNIGMLLDDLKIYECQADLEKPVVNNPPQDITVECNSDIPTIPNLDIKDNCDLNPNVTLKETTNVIDACTKIITRTWTISDACGNINTQTQIVNVIDHSQPQFSVLPQTKIVKCDTDVLKAFNDWIKKNGDAIATDACGSVKIRTVYARLPKNTCDSVSVDFIATDPCGNETEESAYFIVKNSSAPKFIVKPRDVSIDQHANVRDSLSVWLNSFADSKVSNTTCDTVVMSSDFNGDSTKNPLKITFYAKDRCGDIDSASATFSILGGGSKCCCGTPTELFYPNLDFEAPPIAPPGGWIDYVAGDNYAGWQINAGSVSIHSPTHLNLGAGNPNGASQHMDLHGFNQGTATYTLTGLTAGNNYTIAFWYAIHSFGANVSARLMVNGGSLLNVSWSATNTGDVLWLPTMYDFIANGPTADMTFVGTGATPCCGMLIDDIHIFECPADNEKPKVKVKPLDWYVECEIDAPVIPILEVTDNCDPNPKITFNETKETIDPCTKKITRNWRIEDACGNVTLESQIISIIDTNPPLFLKKPLDKLVYCQQDIAKEFNDWTRINGNATARDDCGPVSWRIDYDHVPKKYCDTVIVAFIAIDHCGNESSDFGKFIVKDTSKLRYIQPAQNKLLMCNASVRDSLRDWLQNDGYSKASNHCDTIIRSNNFNGDSTKNPLHITFYVKDHCGSLDSTTATFLYSSSSDTFGVYTNSCDYIKSYQDTTVFVLASGCDSVVIHHYNKKPSDSTYIQLNSCDPNQIQFDTLHLKNVPFCDSTVFIQYMIHPTPVTTIQINDCSFLNYSKDTSLFSGQYCDSLVIHEYIPLRKDSIVIQNNTCDKNKQDTIKITLKNSLGCDSIVTIQTIFTRQLQTLVASKECGLKNNYIDTITINTGFCDSLVITQHLGLPIDTTLISGSTCDASQSGIFTNSFKNLSGCDSIIVQTISLLRSDSTFVSKTTCQLALAGIDVSKSKNIFGCDSIVTTTTTFIPSDTLFIHSFSCDISKLRNDTLVKPAPLCDSVIITKIDYVQADTTRINTTTCDINQQGIASKIFHTGLCDSVVITKTTFIPSDTNSIQQTSCIPSRSGIDTVVFKNVGGCDSLIYYNTLFVPKHVDLQLDSISCTNKNDGKILILNENVFTKPIDIFLNQQNISNSNAADQLGPGFYQFSVRDKDGCVSDTISFQLSNPDAFTTDLGPDFLVDPGLVIHLHLSANKTPVSVFWLPQGITTCTQCTDIDYQVTQDGWIYTLSIDDRSCESLDSIFVQLRKASKIFAPNAISPNGDNINDSFYLIGDDDLIIERMDIYDRWGEQLFSALNIQPNHPELGWNGTFKSEKMNPGVYVYYATIRLPNGLSQELKGNFTLIR